MAQSILPICGDLVEPSALALPKARELARFLQSATNPFARLLECRARAGEEIVVLELDVELPQRPTHDIRHTEQLATIFFEGDRLQPEVLSLRPDFPLVPHLNLESMARGGNLRPGVHRVIIDEAHVTLEQNPGVEIAAALCRRAGVLVDYMSATVDPGTLEKDLGVTLVDCLQRGHPIEYRNLRAPLEDVLPNLVRQFLVDRHGLSENLMRWDSENPMPRAVGMLVVVNSHASENSDTLKFAKDLASYREIEVLRLASPIIRHGPSKRAFDEKIRSIEERNGRYVIVATNVVEMGITFDSLDFVVTMDTEPVNVTTEFGTELTMRSLSVNALLQRAGRVGRKRPGMCFIARAGEQAGAWYSDLPDPAINEGRDRHPDFRPTCVRYPLLTGNLQPLAVLSFQERIGDADLRDWLASLRLPSRPEDTASRFEDLRKSRERLKKLGLAGERALTSLGEASVRHVGVEDLGFALLSASSPSERIRLPLGVVAAMGEFGLVDLLAQSAVLSADRREQRHWSRRNSASLSLSLTQRLGGRDVDDPSSNRLGADPEEIASTLTHSGEGSIDSLFDSGMHPYYVGEVARLVANGYHVVPWTQVVGPRPRPDRLGNRLDYDRQVKRWEQDAAQAKLYLHLERPLIQLDPQSDLITAYNIAQYFFNAHMSYLEQQDLSEVVRLEMESAFREEARGLELEATKLREALRRLQDLLRHVAIRLPMSTGHVPVGLQLTGQELEALLETSIREALKEGGLMSYLRSSSQLTKAIVKLPNARDFPRRLPTYLLEEVLRTTLHGAERHSRLDVAARLLGHAWSRFVHEREGFGSLWNRRVLPTLTAHDRDRMLDHIKSTPYALDLVLTRNALGNYVGKYQDLDVELNTSKSSVQMTGESVEVMAKLVPRNRPDGAPYLAAVHVTLLRDSTGARALQHRAHERGNGNVVSRR